MTEVAHHPQVIAIGEAGLDKLTDAPLSVQLAAFEYQARLAMETGHAVPHGYAVAWGMVCELYLSAVRLSFPTAMLHQMTKYIASLYSRFYFDCKQYDRIYDTITHDKKNTGDRISCTLLKDVGRYVINEEISKNEIFEALDYYRECM